MPTNVALMSHAMAKSSDIAAECSIADSINESAVAQIEEPSPLLRLPGELRNRIYGLVVPKDEKIETTTMGHSRPALLNVCKMIRRDTLKLFYDDNTFTFNVPDWNMAGVMKLYTVMGTFVREHREIFGRTCGVNVNIRLDLVRTPHWKNVLEWMRLIHRGLLTGSKFTECDMWKAGQSGVEITAITTMVDQAIKLAAQPWDLVKDVISSQRAVLACINEEWMEDK